MEIDYSDLWPRYYFDFECAKSEVESWMKTRGEWTESSVWINDDINY